MDGLKETAEAVSAALADKENKRELALAESRKIIRLSKNVIHAIHVGEPFDKEKQEMESKMAALVAGLSEDMLLSGPAADAMMEFSEAELLSDVVYGNRLRSFGELGITPQSWLMGLADVIGELRRVIVTELMRSNTDRAVSLFAGMEEITEELMLFDVPDAVLPVRRKQDVARSLVEKTRSDLLSAAVSKH